MKTAKFITGLSATIAIGTLPIVAMAISIKNAISYANHESENMPFSNNFLTLREKAILNLWN